jgi:hypothetical protein
MKINVEGKTEYDRFRNLLCGVLAVPHSEIKAKLDAYERAKKLKRTAKRKRERETQ